MRYAEIIANRIKEQCKLWKISINKLASMSGLRQSTLDSILHGDSRNPTVKTLHRIATALNMTLAEFLDFDELNQYSFDDESAE